MKPDEPSVVTLILGSATRCETIDAILTHLVEEGALPLDAVAEVRDGIERREALGSTALGYGVAMPHHRHARVDRPVLTLALLRRPNTDWDSLDGEPVDIVFLIVVPREPLVSYRAYFERLHRKLGAEFSERLRRSKTAEELAEALEEEEFRPDCLDP